MASSVEQQPQSASQSHIPSQIQHRALRSKNDEPASNGQIPQGNNPISSTTQMHLGGDLDNASNDLSASFHLPTDSLICASEPLVRPDRHETATHRVKQPEQLTGHCENEAYRDHLFQQAAAAVAQGAQGEHVQHQARQSQSLSQPQHQQPVAPKPTDTMSAAGNGVGVAQHPQSQSHQAQNAQQANLPQLQQQSPGQSPNNPSTPMQQQSSRIDPAIEGPYGSVRVPTTPGQGNNDPDASMVDELTPEGRHSNMSKRALSQSKRAAQNRAAQRAFRARKETYIKKLEDQVQNASIYAPLQQDLSRFQNENFQLRDYIMALQIRLLEAGADYPPPPPGIELRDPKVDDSTQQQHQSIAAATASMGSTPASHLQAAAAAAAQSGNYDPKGGPGGEQFGDTEYTPRPLPNAAGAEAQTKPDGG
ncbi:MAG: hypothetical protein M1831_007320 [Alyxoria varia]|nr:MAG: hypothetical protein M1831_007320 [Alyxoria varia]